MTDSRPRGGNGPDPTIDRGEHAPAAPFKPRDPSAPAWWCRPATAEELDAVERQRREREVLSGVRKVEGTSRG